MRRGTFPAEGRAQRVREERGESIKWVWCLERHWMALRVCGPACTLIA
jgi:hypothetical protein